MKAPRQSKHIALGTVSFLPTPGFTSSVYIPKNPVWVSSQFVIPGNMKRLKTRASFRTTSPPKLSSWNSHVCKLLMYLSLKTKRIPWLKRYGDCHIKPSWVGFLTLRIFNRERDDESSSRGMPVTGSGGSLGRGTHSPSAASCLLFNKSQCLSSESHVKFYVSIVFELPLLGHLS